MTERFIEVELDNEQKAMVLKYADFFVTHETTKADLKNKRKKWIRFQPYYLSQIIGELCYYFNRCEDDDEFHRLDRLISELEAYDDSEF